MEPINNTADRERKEEDFHVGQNLDILDSVNKWMNAEVRFVGHGNIYIHYSGWTYKYDESIPITSNRILKQWQPGMPIKINNRVDAYHPIGGWLQARVIDLQYLNEGTTSEEVSKVKVHFFNYDKKYDIWVDISDSNQVSIIGSRSKAYGMGKNRRKQVQTQKLSELYAKLLKEKMNCLQEKLSSKNLVIKQSGGDGNCLFRSISDQLYGKQDYFAEIRKFCMDYISYEKGFFQDYIAEDIDQYIDRKRKNGEWGDDVEIQALSQIYNRPIQVYVFDDSPIRTFHEDNQQQIEPIRLNYAGACHYNSIKNIQKINVGLLETNFGDFQQIFFTSYKTHNMAEITRNRNLFSFSNRIEDTIGEQIEAQKREQTKIQDELNKALQISEREAILEEIENAELKEFQMKYEQQKLQEQLKKLEQKQMEEAKKMSASVNKEPEIPYQVEKPYWFEEIKAQGFSDKEIWFAIEVKGYDPDAVQNFLLDNM